MRLKICGVCGKIRLPKIKFLKVSLCGKEI